MKKTKDIMSNIILAAILLIISGLIFYMFFYSGSKKTNQKPPPPSTEQFASTETKYKGKSVYVIDSQIKIRSKPNSDATVLDKKEKGEKLIVSGAWGDWFEVMYDYEKKGWVLRDQVSDRKPAAKIPDTPSVNPESESQEKNQALDFLRTDIDNLVAFINQRALQQFSKEIVKGFEIADKGSKLIMYISETWYYLPPVQKQVMFNLIAMQYGKQACQYKVRPECSSDDFPTISFINPENREIATMAANRPLQIFE